MSWIESVSPSFRARHDSAQIDSASRVLYGLEHTRAALEPLFPRVPADITVVLHGGPVGLVFTNPLLPLVWSLTAPAGRRYVVGWTSKRELHVLAPTALAARAANVEGSRQMLALSPAALYARRVIAENNPALHKAKPHARVALELRWAWLLEGGARWFAGQTEHARHAIARRLREGARPAFPPGLRDSTLLGQTVIDFLARVGGPGAAADFVCRFEPHDPRAALARAFGARSEKQLEHAWLNHIAALASAG